MVSKKVMCLRIQVIDHDWERRANDKSLGHPKSKKLMYLAVKDNIYSDGFIVVFLPATLPYNPLMCKELL